MRRQFVVLACLLFIGTQLPQVVRAVPMDVGHTVMTPLADMSQPARSAVVVLPREEGRQKLDEFWLLSVSDASSLDAVTDPDDQNISINDLTKVDEEGTWLGTRLMRLIRPADLAKTYKTWIPSPRK